MDNLTATKKEIVVTCHVCHNLLAKRRKLEFSENDIATTRIMFQCQCGSIVVDLALDGTPI